MDGYSFGRQLVQGQEHTLFQRQDILYGKWHWHWRRYWYLHTPYYRQYIYMTVDIISNIY